MRENLSNGKHTSLAKNLMKTLSILILFNLVSCKELESTDAETNAVQNVLNFYGGECLKSKGSKLENGDNKVFYELEISKSELLDLQSKKIKTHSGNIAYLFFSNLGNEQKNYDEIRVTTNLSNGSTQEFLYSKKELLEIENLKSSMDKINESIVKDDYNCLYTYFDKSVDIDSDKIATLFNTLEHQYGKISKVQFQGFEFKKTNNFGDVILVNEALILGETGLSMNIVFKRDNNKIISIEFE